MFSVGVTDGEISYSGGRVTGDLNYTLLVSATDSLGASVGDGHGVSGSEQCAGVCGVELCVYGKG